MAVHTVESIFEIFKDRLQPEGLWFIIALQKAGKPLLKEQLKEEVNRIYIEKKDNPKPLITSRYILDRYTERLEGAGLVDVNDVGKARMYTLSELGLEFFEYNMNRSKNK